MVAGSQGHGVALLQVDEVGFRLLPCRGVREAGKGLPAARVADWFAHQVSRAPHDLRRHVQRIYFLSNQGGGAELGDALIDLMLVLQGRGKDLCRRLLAEMMPRIPPDYQAWLRDMEEGGVFRNRALPSGACPCLGSGLTGEGELLWRDGEGGDSP